MIYAGAALYLVGAILFASALGRFMRGPVTTRESLEGPTAGYCCRQDCQKSPHETTTDCLLEIESQSDAIDCYRDQLATRQRQLAAATATIAALRDDIEGQGAAINLLLEENQLLKRRIEGMQNLLLLEDPF